jgi:hypothetical protein
LNFFYLNIFLFIKPEINMILLRNGDWGLGIGDWGLGIGDWAQSPIPIPNPQSPIPRQEIKLKLIK